MTTIVLASEYFQDGFVGVRAIIRRAGTPTWCVPSYVIDIVEYRTQWVYQGEGRWAWVPGTYPPLGGAS